MQIHVVNKGDSLFAIANTYGTTIEALIDANELDTPNNLVVGQALVIPVIGQYYYVQPGDTLASIAQQFNITLKVIARINQIQPSDTLYIGMRIFIPPHPREKITSFAYVEPRGSTVSEYLINATDKTAPSLTFLAIFSYTINRDGSLNPPPLNNFKKYKEESNTALSLVVSNLEDFSFSTELVHIVLTVQAVQNELIDNIVNTAVNDGYSDVHFDFEFIPPDDKETYNSFLRKIKERLSQAGILLSTALAPKTSATQKGTLYEAHDYKAHGEIADFVVLMTYEWGYSAGPPLPVSPINEVENVVKYAITEIPREKILLGQNLYGYDWKLPFVAGESFARALSPQQVITLAREQNVAIEYNSTAQAPFFTYYDEERNKHEVWSEDARSIQAKFDLIKAYNLLGISYWKLGLKFPQNWLLLHSNFYINKILP